MRELRRLNEAVARVVAAARSRLVDPEFRPVVRLLNILARLRERDPESFRKVIGTLHAGLMGRFSLELRDVRRFVIMGPIAVPETVVNDRKRGRFRTRAVAQSQS